jgi:hypothetical protein
MLLGSAVTGLLLYLAALYVSRLPPAFTLSALACALVFPVTDVLGRQGLTFPRRQTYGAAIAYVDPRTAYVLWGFDIGLGFTTYRVSRDYWSGLVLLAVGTPLICFAGTVTYAAALFAGAMSNRSIHISHDRMVSRRRRLGVSGCVLSLGVLITALAAGIAS